MYMMFITSNARIRIDTHIIVVHVPQQRNLFVICVWVDLQLGLLQHIMHNWHVSCGNDQTPHPNPSHCFHQADADRQATEQADKATRAKRTGERILVKLSISGTPLDADVRLAEVRDTTRAMLSELRSLATSHPGCGIAEACEAAGLRLPVLGTSGSATPLSGSARGSYAGGGSDTHSRPVSALSTGSAGGRGGGDGGSGGRVVGGGTGSSGSLRVAGTGSQRQTSQTAS